MYAWYLWTCFLQATSPGSIWTQVFFFQNFACAFAGAIYQARDACLRALGIAPSTVRAYGLTCLFRPVCGPNPRPTAKPNSSPILAPNFSPSSSPDPSLIPSPELVSTLAVASAFSLQALSPSHQHGNH